MVVEQGAGLAGLVLGHGGGDGELPVVHERVGDPVGPAQGPAWEEVGQAGKAGQADGEGGEGCVGVLGVLEGVCVVVGGLGGRYRCGTGVDW